MPALPELVRADTEAACEGVVGFEGEIEVRYVRLADDE
jgi:hypothetical protein